jgi:hypothetical protein
MPATRIQWRKTDRRSNCDKPATGLSIEFAGGENQTRMNENAERGPGEPGRARLTPTMLAGLGPEGRQQLHAALRSCIDALA